MTNVRQTSSRASRRDNRVAAPWALLFSTRTAVSACEGRRGGWVRMTCRDASPTRSLLCAEIKPLRFVSSSAGRGLLLVEFSGWPSAVPSLKNCCLRFRSPVHLGGIRKVEKSFDISCATHPAREQRGQTITHCWLGSKPLLQKDHRPSTSSYRFGGRQSCMGDGQHQADAAATHATDKMANASCMGSSKGSEKTIKARYKSV